MADVTVNAQLDAACEKFRKILEKQLVRIEDMKSQGDFVDYAKVETLRIGVCGGDGIGPTITAEARRVLEFMLADMVAAGNSFNGGLAVALTEGKSLRKSVKFANARARFP